MEPEKQFSFNVLAQRGFKFEKDNDIKTLLMKWSMKGRLLCQTFSFDQPYQLYLKNQFFKDFFQSPQVVNYLHCLAKDGGRMLFSGEMIARIELEHLNAKILSLDFFDRIYNNSVVRKSGHICQCFSEVIEGVEVCDELRKMFLVDDSDNYSLFDESERNEFLFRIFMLLGLGGELCQPENSIQPILDTAKAIYKDCVSVAKDAKTNSIDVISDVYKIKAYDDKDTLIYPCEEEHVQNVAFAVIDPIKRHVTILYHRFGVGELPKAN